MADSTDEGTDSKLDFANWRETTQRRASCFLPCIKHLCKESQNTVGNYYVFLATAPALLYLGMAHASFSTGPWSHLLPAVDLSANGGGKGLKLLGPGSNK